MFVGCKLDGCRSAAITRSVLALGQMLVVSYNQSKQVRGQIVPPAPAEQLRFLTNIQRPSSRGIFTATYKYALLAVLADLSVELGDESGSALRLFHIYHC